MGKQHVGCQHGYGSHQEAGLPTEGYPGNNGQGHDGLELGQHEERRPACQGDGAEHCNSDQFPRLWFPALENKEEWNRTLQQHQKGDEIVFLPRQIGLPTNSVSQIAVQPRRIWLIFSGKHHSNRLVGRLTPFRLP